MTYSGTGAKTANGKPLCVHQFELLKHNVTAGYDRPTSFTTVADIQYVCTSDFLVVGGGLNEVKIDMDTRPRDKSTDSAVFGIENSTDGSQSHPKQ